MIDVPTGDANAARQAGRAALFVAGCLSLPMSHAKVTHSRSSEPAVQVEADYRVIAARCGTPAFERQFFKQSKAAVVAGLVVSGQDAGSVEKAIESRRRNPLQLVSAGAECAGKLSLLKSVQHQREQSMRAAVR